MIVDPDSADRRRDAAAGGLDQVITLTPSEIGGVGHPLPAGLHLDAQALPWNISLEECCAARRADSALPGGGRARVIAIPLLLTVST